jgi:hypothetical protein
MGPIRLEAGHRTSDTRREMKRTGKTLGPIIAMVLIASAIGASAAQAVSFHSSSASGTTFLTGNQATTNVFTTTALNVKCKVAIFSGSYTGGTTATDLTITPHYTECTGGGQAVTVTVNGCTYTFTQPTSKTTGNVDLLCPGSNVITIDIPAGNCSLTIGPQTLKGDVDYTNQTEASGKKDVLVTATVIEIDHTVHGPGAICGAIGFHPGETVAGVSREANYTGTVTAKGYSDAAHTNQVDIFVE